MLNGLSRKTLPLVRGWMAHLLVVLKRRRPYSWFLRSLPLSSIGFALNEGRRNWPATQCPVFDWWHACPSLSYLDSEPAKRPSHAHVDC